MGRYAKETGGGDFAQAPAGTHAARCIRLIDIGTHHGEFQGKPTVRNQLIAQFELPDETVEVEGQQKPFIVSKFYTNSLHEKSNMRKDLEGWRGRPFTVEELLRFDVQTILGQPCILSIVHTDEGKAKIASIAKPMKGMSIPPAVNKVDSFWIEEWDDNKFAALPEGFKKLIVASDEYKENLAPPGPSHNATAQGVDDDDIPF